MEQYRNKMNFEDTAINILLVLAMIMIAFLIIVMFSTFVFGWGTQHGDNKPTEKGCKQADTLKEYARLVDDMKCKGEPELKEFMEKYHSSMNEEQHKCIEHRADLGNELYEDEIMKCYKKHD